MTRMMICDEITADLMHDFDLSNRNSYSYCDNNPIARVDENGEFWLNVVIGAAVGAVVGAVSSIASQLITEGAVNHWSEVVVAAVGGAITGGLAATGVKVSGQKIANAIVGGVSGIVNYSIEHNNEDFNLLDMGFEAFEGAVIGYVAGKVGGDGTGSKHLTSSRHAFKKALENGKPVKSALKYTMSQTKKESIKCGIRAIPSILKASTPVIAAAVVHRGLITLCAY